MKCFYDPIEQQAKFSSFWLYVKSMIFAVIYGVLAMKDT